MLKSELMRAAIVAHNPFFRENPDRLEVYVTKGRVHSTGRPSPSFAYGYELNVLAMEFPGSLDDLTIPILSWAVEHQPDLLFNKEKREKGISFDADILDNNTADILYVIDASELVIVSRDEAGRLTGEHRDEPRHFEFEPGNTWSTLLVADASGKAETLRGAE